MNPAPSLEEVVAWCAEHPGPFTLHAGAELVETAPDAASAEKLWRAALRESAGRPCDLLLRTKEARLKLVFGTPAPAALLPMPASAPARPEPSLGLAELVALFREEVHAHREQENRVVQAMIDMTIAMGDGWKNLNNAAVGNAQRATSEAEKAQTKTLELANLATGAAVELEQAKADGSFRTELLDAGVEIFGPVLRDEFGPLVVQVVKAKVAEMLPGLLAAPAAPSPPANGSP